MSAKATISLSKILDLVGKLDDSSGEDNPRERFRRFLKENVREVGQVRDFIEECLRLKGIQYNCALQDLINHLGVFLGFEVVFGRYHGVVGQLGFDGRWISPSGFHIVIEAKTTEAFAIKTSSLLGYVDGLISEKEIPNWASALGLYVVGGPDPELRQLENSIVAERRINQLRTISVESLLSLSELMTDYDVNHDDILAVLRPSEPKVDPIVDLMKSLMAQALPTELVEEPSIESVQLIEDEGEPSYWITPVKSDEHAKAEEIVYSLVGEEKIYAFGERTPGRKHLRPGDLICFYATGKGVIAHATIMSRPERKKHPKVHEPDKYPWIFKVGKAKFYLDEPVIIDADLRGQLDAFKGKDSSKPWSWFVFAARKISKNDYELLTADHGEGRN